MKGKTIFFILLFIFCVSCIAPAATHYVRSNATGNGSGSDWANAYTNLPSALSRGDTYYIADGNYGAYTFDDAASGNQVITIRKATVDDNGTDVGWSTSYGDGQAVFSTIRFNTDDWVFDGRRGGGPGSWDQGFGFLLVTPGSSLTKLCRLGTGVDNITIRHTDMVYSDNADGTSSYTDQDTFYCLGGSNITISFCAMKYPGRVHFLTANINNMTLEYSYLYYCKTNPSQHAESWSDQGSDNVTIRHCLFKDNMGTGIIVVLSRGGISRSDNWKIYGNVFYGGVRTYDNTDAAICVINDQIANNWKIYNNTFINLHGGFNHTGIQFNSSSGGGHEIYNNLWYNCEAVMYNGNYTADYDYFIANTSSPNEAHSQIGGTSDPFVSYPLFDFHLRNATENGRNDLGSPYHIDPDGTMRGSDGIWDRGAYEFGGSPVQYPDPPQSLRIVQ